jgi:hypothetical protein
MSQTYHVDVTLSGTGRHIVGPASSQNEASTDLDKIRAAQGNDDSVVCPLARGRRQEHPGGPRQARGRHPLPIDSEPLCPDDS